MVRTPANAGPSAFGLLIYTNEIIPPDFTLRLFYRKTVGGNFGSDASDTTGQVRRRTLRSGSGQNAGIWVCSAPS